MPLLDFFSRLANRSAPSQQVGAPIYGPPQAANPIAPSWMRSGFENVADATMGMAGIPNGNTLANKTGQLMGAGFPLFSSIANPFKSLFGAAPALESAASEVPAAAAIKQGVKSVAPQGKPILDDAGRLLGFEQAEDPVFAAHVASSRNKKSLPPKPTMVDINSRYGNLAPSANQVEAMMAKYKR